MELWKEMERKICVSGHSFISVTGGGGKTTFLIEFGQYLKNKGRSVLLTTTTKLGSPSSVDYHVDNIAYSVEEIMDKGVRKGESTLFAHYDEKKDKLVSPNEEELLEVERLFDCVLSEADGARGRSVKIHTHRDPVIFKITTAIVAVMGVWGIGETAYCAAFGDDRDVIIDSNYLDCALSSEEGLLKGMREDLINILLFNGGDKIDENKINTIKSLHIPSSLSGYIVSEKENRIYEFL